MRPLAARPAELRRLIDLRLRRHRLRAIRLDHHQPGIRQDFLRIDPRFLGARGRGGPGRFVARLFPAGLFALHDRFRTCFLHPRLLFARFLVTRLFMPRLFVPGLFVARLLLALRFQLVDAPLGLDHCRVADLRLLLARTIAAIAVAPAAIAPPTPVLLALAFLPGLGWLTLLLRRLGLLPLGELVELRRFSAGHHRLQRLRGLLLRTALVWTALLVTILLRASFRSRAAIRAWTAIRPRTTVAARLPVALLLSVPGLPIAPRSVAPALQPALLLAIAAATAPVLAAAAVIPAASAALEAITAAALLLLVAPRITLRALLARLR